MNKLKDLLNKSKTIVKSYTFDPNYKLPVSTETGAESYVFNDDEFSLLFNQRRDIPFDQKVSHIDIPFLNNEDNFNEVSSHVMDEMHHQANEFNKKHFGHGAYDSSTGIITYDPSQDTEFVQRMNKIKAEREANEKEGVFWTDDEYQKRVDDVKEDLIEMDNKRTFIDEIGNHKDRVFPIDPLGNFHFDAPDDSRANDQARKVFTTHILRGLKDTKNAEHIEYDPFKNISDHYLNELTNKFKIDFPSLPENLQRKIRDKVGELKKEFVLGSIKKIREDMISQDPNYDLEEVSHRRENFAPLVKFDANIDLFRVSPSVEDISEKVRNIVRSHSNSGNTSEKTLILNFPGDQFSSIRNKEDERINGFLKREEVLSRFPERYGITKNQNIIVPSVIGHHINSERFGLRRTAPIIDALRREKLIIDDKETDDLYSEAKSMEAHAKRKYISGVARTMLHELGHLFGLSERDNFFSGSPYIHGSGENLLLEKIAKKAKEMKNRKKFVTRTVAPKGLKLNQNILEKIFDSTLENDLFRREVIDATTNTSGNERFGTFGFFGTRKRKRNPNYDNLDNPFELMGENEKTPTIDRFIARNYL